jgi:hypothetical protein
MRTFTRHEQPVTCKHRDFGETLRGSCPTSLSCHVVIPSYVLCSTILLKLDYWLVFLMISTFSNFPLGVRGCQSTDMSISPAGLQ